ncbi:unnamed protein product [Rhizophagus irregularis]|nr:unnamed protein product [Rhizophagus irregularis]
MPRQKKKIAFYKKSRTPLQEIQKSQNIQLDNDSIKEFLQGNIFNNFNITFNSIYYKKISKIKTCYGHIYNRTIIKNIVLYYSLDNYYNTTALPQGTSEEVHYAPPIKLRIIRIAPCRTTTNRSYRGTAAETGTRELTESKRLCSNPRIVLYRSKKISNQPYCETAAKLVLTGLQSKHTMLPPTHSIMLLQLKVPNKLTFDPTHPTAIPLLRKIMSSEKQEKKKVAIRFVIQAWDRASAEIIRNR